MGNVKETFRTDPISSLRLSAPVTVAAGATVGAALEAVQRHGMGYVLVVDGGRPVGIMSEREVLMKIVAKVVKYDDSVDDYMTPNPPTLTEKDRVASAIKIMGETGQHNIPIVGAAGEAVAVLRTLDIINFLAEAFPAQVLNLPPRPHQALTRREGG